MTISKQDAYLLAKQKAPVSTTTTIEGVMSAFIYITSISAKRSSIFEFATSL